MLANDGCGAGKMSGSGSSSSNNNNNHNSGNRNGYSFPDFSLRRLLLQTRAARSPYAARMCDVERGGSGSGKSDKNGCSSSSMNAKVSFNSIVFVI